jgi:hypothetical protein
MTFRSDYKFGKQQENKHLETIKTFFKDDMKPTSHFCAYDFESETTLYEMKSRNNTYNKFPSTLIAYDKVRENKKLIFLFNFTDGIYYIQYNKEEFSNFKLEPFRRIQRSDFNDKEKLYYFIPITKLIKIC